MDDDHSRHALRARPSVQSTRLYSRMTLTPSSVSPSSVVRALLQGCSLEVVVLIVSGRVGFEPSLPSGKELGLSQAVHA